MKKSTKVFLGIASIWPLIYIPLFLLAIFSMILMGDPGRQPDAFPLVFMVIMPLHFLTILGSIAVKVFFIVDIFKNPRVEKDKQLMWVLLLVFVGMFADPIYWYLNIWRDSPNAAQGAPKALNNGDGASWNDVAGMNRRETDFATPPPPHSWRD